MKHLTPYILTAILSLTLSFNAQAQSPEKFNYQAVLRNNGNLVVNDAVDVRFTIRNDSAAGASVYQETHSTTTDQYGLINLAVGSGTVVSGTFSSINWGGGSKYLQVEVDYGPGGYDDMGARQLLSVPYALHAGGSGGGSWSLTGNAGTDSTNFIGTTDNEPLRIKINGVRIGLIATANTAFGYDAFKSNTTGYNNIAMGGGALQANTTGYSNIAMGSQALNANTTGDDNIALGTYALKKNTIGVDNTALGFFSLFNNITGQKNVAIGRFTLSNSSSANYNVAIGDEALRYNTIGTNNVAIGSDALKTNSTGTQNIAVGERTLYKNTTGDVNIALGIYALYNNTTGEFNTANGYYALKNNTSGDYNTGIGFSADVADTNLINATAIGNKAYVAQSNSMVLGSINGINGATADTRVGIGTTMPNELLEVNGSVKFGDTIYFGNIEYIFDDGFAVIGVNGGLHSTVDAFDDLGTAAFRWQDVYATNGTIQTSDRRDKTAIKDLNYGLKEIMQLRPVRYKWKEQEYQGYKLGVIAQEIQAILPEVVKDYDWKRQEDGTVKKVKLERLGVYYSDIIPVLINAIQEQQVQIQAKDDKIKALEANNKKQTVINSQLQQAIQKLQKRLSVLEQQ